jgi:lia operon protein LiaF
VMRVSLSPGEASATRITIGAGTVASGVLFALNGLGVTKLSWGTAFDRYWPGLLLLWGLLETLGGLREFARYRRLRWWPLIVAAAGAILLAANLHFLDATAGLIWALGWAALAVFIGVEILFGSVSIGDTRYRVNRQDAKDALHDVGVSMGMGVGSKHVREDDAFELEDRVYRHGLGDFQLDLSHARLREGETHLAIYGGIGEIQVLLPEGLAVDIEAQVRIGAVKIFGRKSDGLDRSLSYRSEGYADAVRRVRIDMVMRMGDITVERVF